MIRPVVETLGGASATLMTKEVPVARLVAHGTR
jgi:hypothetical protein